MDTITRNEIMGQNEYLIKAIIKRNRTLIKALRLETDDVYQDLMISMLNAIEEYDSMRSDSISAYIFAKLQYAILDMKRRYKPCGITGTGKNRVSFISVECYYDDGNAYEIPIEDDTSAIDLSDIFAMLSSSEREAMNMSMDGYYLRKKNERNNFAAAREKLLSML